MIDIINEQFTPNPYRFLGKYAGYDVYYDKFTYYAHIPGASTYLQSDTYTTFDELKQKIDKIVDKSIDKPIWTNI